MNLFEQAFAAAANGPVAEGDLISIRRNARLRVTYNWLYSALNVDPNDGSSFPWIVTKLDATHVSLSPKNGWQGKRLYASVRPDLGYRVQTQAPFSADWITAVGADEIIAMSSPGLQMLRFQGLNGQLINVEESMTQHQSHARYLVNSNGSQLPDAYTWFFAVTAVLQSGLQIKLANQLSPSDIRDAFASAGLDGGDARVASLHALLG